MNNITEESKVVDNYTALNIQIDTMPIILKCFLIAFCMLHPTLSNTGIL